jgi:Uma2 family endonuclease
MAATTPKLLTLEEYLELERTSDIRHEFVDGELIAMAGEKRRHNRVVGAIYRLLIERALERHCEVVFESVKIRTRTGRVRYPDGVVSCAPGDDDYFLENPCFIVEVLSDSTKATDFTTKLDEYKNLPTLDRYVLLAQDKPLAVLYKRVGDHWEVETLAGEGEIDIPCLALTLTLGQIYQLV